jgi:hypothetical protein
MNVSGTLLPHVAPPSRKRARYAKAGWVGLSDDDAADGIRNLETKDRSRGGPGMSQVTLPGEEGWRGACRAMSACSSDETDFARVANDRTPPIATDAAPTTNVVEGLRPD